MDLGTKQPKLSTEAASPSRPKKTIQYPTVTLEKPLGNYKYGDEFTATVRCRVKNIEHGEAYSGSEPKHRCTLELISIEPQKTAKKGFPHS